MPQPGERRYCATCRIVLMATRMSDGGQGYKHHNAPRDGHAARPVPLEALSDGPVILCDFCRSDRTLWVYRTVDISHTGRVVVSETRRTSDYQNRYLAARVVSQRTAQAPTHYLGENWAACGPCAELLDSGDIMTLIIRAMEDGPASWRTPKNLPRRRAELFDVYSKVVMGLQPGRLSVEEALRQGI